MNNKKHFVSDERDEINTGKASQWALIFIIVFVLGKFVFYIGFSNITNISFLLWDALMIIIASILFLVVLHARKTYTLPRTFFGSKLLTDSSKKGKKDRILKSYLPETLIFALGATLGSYLLSGFNNFLNGMTEFFLFFIIYYLISYFWGEFIVRRYNKALEE